MATSKELAERIATLESEEPGTMPNEARRLYQVTREHSLALLEIAYQLAVMNEGNGNIA